LFALFKNDWFGEEVVHPCGDAVGTLFVEADKAAANVEISQEGERDAMLTIKPLAASALTRSLTETATTWQVRVKTASN